MARWVSSSVIGCEQVDQDPIAVEALASTLRTRLNYRTAAWQGWQVFLEADNVVVLGDDSYNSTLQRG